MSPEPGGLGHLYSFDGTTASTPEVALMQHTNGEFYGLPYAGGLTCWYNTTCGTVYTFNAGLSPFVNLMSTSGKVGAGVQILGQEFTSATKVWFGPAAATPRTGSGTYLVVSVPSGAETGKPVLMRPRAVLARCRHDIFFVWRWTSAGHTS